MKENTEGGFTIFGIRFAPLSIPFHRRFETFMVFVAVSEFLFGILGCLILPALLFTRFWYLSILYCAWMYYDLDAPVKGGHLWMWTRRFPLWKFFVNYFPITLEKSGDLDPNQNYIIGYHPHGIMGTGALASFATEATGFSKLFPGITTYLVTLDINFWFPLHRDLALVRGLIASSKESINWVLRKRGRGNAVVLVIGGAAESLEAVPNTMRLTLKNRKGFAKLAIQNGANLVPVISFGENEIYVQNTLDDGSLIRKIQNVLKAWFKFTFPVFHGRGMFQYSMGILPYRVPIHTIVGKPIEVTKNEAPTQEEVDRVHAEYIKGLKELFDTHKKKYAKNPAMQLELR